MIGRRLRELRHEQGLSQKELGEKLGLSASAIGMYEQDRREPDNEILGKMCRFFDIKSDFFLMKNAPLERVNSEIDTPRDFEDIIGQFKCELLNRESLMFNGEPLSEDDKKQILDAIEIGTRVALSRKAKTENDSDK